MSNKATEVREQLNQFNPEDRSAEEAFKTVESYIEKVVEEGEFTPGARITADLDLTMKERLTGHREQDLTGTFVLGLMMGAALERDVPKGTYLEQEWRDGNFDLPEE